MRLSKRRFGGGMLAVDTNVVVRYLTDDDAEQSAIARELVGSHAIWLPKTVVLESEWVLRSLYRFTRREIGAGFRAFTRLPNAAAEAPEQLLRALDWFEQGMDFADALHLAASQQQGCEALASFDRKLAAAARKAKAGKIKAL